MKLYEITNEYEAIFNQVGEDGDITEETVTQLDSLTQDFENKAICIAGYIKNLQAEEEAISQAMKDMSARKTKLANKAQSLSEYLQFNLHQLSINEINSSPYYNIKLKKCPPSVDIFDEVLIPDEFWREKMVRTIDKVKIKEQLSEGIDIPGAAIKRNIKLEIK